MRKYSLGLVPFALLACTAAHAGNLGIFSKGTATNTGQLLIGDPAALTAGTGTTTVVDTGLTQAQLENGGGILAASVSGNTASNLRLGRYVYAKGGKIYSINLAPSASHAPVQVSNTGNACGIESVNANFTSTANSWFLVTRNGADHACNTSDDTRSFVRANMAATTAARSVAGLREVETIYSTTGNITGFISFEGSPMQVVRRDANFANPVVLLTLASSNQDSYARIPHRIYIAGTPTGQTKAQLFRFDSASTTLVGPLYTYAGTSASLAFSFEDAGKFFFIDGAKVMRVPTTATASGSAQVVTTAPNNLAIQIMMASPGGNSLFFNAGTFSTGAGVYSALRAGNNAAPTPLKLFNFTTYTAAQLTGAKADLAFINLVTYTSGALSAVRMSADGTTTNNTYGSSYWAGAVSPATFNFDAVSNPTSNPTWMIKATRASGADTVKLYNPSTGANGRTLGTVSSVETSGPAIFSFGLGRYGGAAANIARSPDASDFDSYVFDTSVTGSLTPVVTNVGTDDLGIGVQ